MKNIFYMHSDKCKSSLISTIYRLISYCFNWKICDGWNSIIIKGNLRDSFLNVKFYWYNNDILHNIQIFFIICILIHMRILYRIELCGFSVFWTAFNFNSKLLSEFVYYNNFLINFSQRYFNIRVIRNKCKNLCDIFPKIYYVCAHNNCLSYK